MLSDLSLVGCMREQVRGSVEDSLNMMVIECYPIIGFVVDSV